MPGGRPAKPLELRLKQGNPGKRPLPAVQQVGVTPVAPPTPPATLKSAGKKRWTQIWAVAAQWLGPSDAPAVELTCRLEDELVTLRKRMLSTRQAAMVLQWHWAVSKAEKELLAAYNHLGLTPTARAKLGLVVGQAAEIESRLSHFQRAG